MNGFCDGTNNVNNRAWAGEHRDVAAVDGVSGCTHALREEASKIRVHGAVVVGDDIPTRLRLPGDARGIPAEKIGGWRIMSRP